MMNTISVIYGDDAFALTNTLLASRDWFAGIPPSASIAVKPNLVVAKPSASGATTDPAIVAALIEYLQRRGHQDISIIESAWLGADTKRAFAVCGYEALARRYQVGIFDLKEDEVRDGICQRALEADVLINVPVLKAHCQTRLTCALKNLKGCVPDGEKRRYHRDGIHDPVARLNASLSTHLVIVDAIIGDLVFEEGGTPVHMSRLIAGHDPVLIDAYAATLIGLSPDDVSYIALAESYRVGSADLAAATIIELNDGSKASFSTETNGASPGLAADIDARQACSACYGSLLHACARLASPDTSTTSSNGTTSCTVISPSDWPTIAIGQGHRALTGDGWGIGSCTKGYARSLAGCPPTARQIIDFLTTAGNE